MALADPIRKPMTQAQAAHLLRRATFGPTPAQIKAFTGQTPQAALTALLATQPTPEAPIDPSTLKPFNTLAFVEAQQGVWQSNTKYWWMGLMLNEGSSLREKMTLFWQNHFVSTFAEVPDARYIHRQNAMLRRHALGSFRAFVIDVTKDPAMLQYLDGRLNVNSKPNENYARELQELFTIGATNPVTGQPNYSEDDVKAAARVLTGWIDNGFRSTTVADITTTFRANQHDTTDKKFSAAYGNAVVKGRTGATAGDDELGDLVDMILKQPETARFMVRKLYRYFVHSEIPAAIETGFIEPLAAIFRKDYEIRPVLTALLTSEHFFDESMRGAIIKAPVELTLGTLRYFGIKAPDAVANSAGFTALTAYLMNRNNEQQQNIMDQPSVFGWRPYYDVGHYELWINSTTLALRGRFADEATQGSIPYGGTARATLDLIEQVRQTAQPSDPIVMLTELTSLMLAVPLSKAQIEQLASEVLMPGVPIYEWTEIWNKYLAAPTVTAHLNAVRTRLNSTMNYIFRMAEYQLN
jgi:uncharacterized protein (DUF1800 family)